MHPSRYFMSVAVALAALQPVPAGADDFAGPGRRIYELRCKGCHESIPSTAERSGPVLNGIIGRAAGAGDTGVHSRAAVESGMVWTRSALRRYLSDPAREMPGTLMSAQVRDPKELDSLLNYLETLR